MDRRADVKRTYDRIATHFASTREYAWPEVQSFVSALDSPGTADSGAPSESGEARPVTGLDLGCGNCRHAELLAADCDRVLGIDVSRNLLETGRERATARDFEVNLLCGDAARLPLADETVDVAVYVATIHHLPTRAARIDSLDELARVLSPGGRGLVSAWSTAHSRFEDCGGDGFDTTIEWTLPGGETVDRFYHIYAPEEFEADLESSALTLETWELSSGNCYAVVSSGER